MPSKIGEIDGVKVTNLCVHQDDRGTLTELAHQGKFGEIRQVTLTETDPGVIKAFHWHERQKDGWAVISGRVRVVLFDTRRESKTFQRTQVIFTGGRQIHFIEIPPGVAHGYQVLGKKKAVLIYVTTREYNPEDPDEQRIAFDDPLVGFDWTIQNR